MNANKPFANRAALHFVITLWWCSVLSAYVLRSFILAGLVQAVHACMFCFMHASHPVTHHPVTACWLWLWYVPHDQIVHCGAPHDQQAIVTIACWSCVNSRYSLSWSVAASFKSDWLLGACRCLVAPMGYQRTSTYKEYHKWTLLTGYICVMLEAWKVCFAMCLISAGCTMHSCNNSCMPPMQVSHSLIDWSNRQYLVWFITRHQSILTYIHHVLHS